MDNHDLCLALISSESENEVIQILDKEGYWNDKSCWRLYGDNEMNYSIIGAQQSLPEAALVEKLTNSIDAMLLLECKLRGIDPKDRMKAPKSIQDASDLFFDVKEGILSRIAQQKRNELSENIMLVTTGSSGRKKKPNYLIIDKGEGQSPTDFPDTLLSLNKTNKRSVFFVQGRFNMGSTGALQFCGEHGLQLIVSKKHPRLSNDDRWGFTVVRRFRPHGEMKNSEYRYLVDNQSILSFSADSLPILPGRYPVPYMEKLHWGTIIKLYEYNIAPRYRGPSYFDLNYRLAMLLAQPALPIRVFERRSGYSGHSPEAILSGLTVRLDEDPRENLEFSPPLTATINISGEKMSLKIYCFKDKKSKNRYAVNEGVLFLVGGQNHGSLSKTVFKRGQLKLDYISNELLVIADCSEFSLDAIERVFMNSRDRLYEVDWRNTIEKEIMKILASSRVLRDLNHQRQNERRAKMIGDSRPLQDLMEKFVQISPNVASLLIEGHRIHTKPYDLRPAREQEKYNGKFYPDLFEPKPKEKLHKLSPINRDFRIQFVTDAADDYFKRDHHQGEFRLELNGTATKDWSLHLENGIATLTGSHPIAAQTGEIHQYNWSVTDPSQSTPFEGNFKVELIDAVLKKSGRPGTRLKPPSEEPGKKRETPKLRALPNPIPVKSDEWDEYDFDEFSVLSIVRGDDGKLDFFYNIENTHYLNEMKSRPQTDQILIQETWKTAIVLIGMAFLAEQKRSDPKKEFDMDAIGLYTRALGALIIPMVNDLGKLLLGKEE